MSATPSLAARPDAAVAPRLPVLAAFAAIYLFWGATFLALRVAVHVVPPFLTIAIRCAGGALILAAWLRWRGGGRRPTAAQWRTAAIAGVLLFLGCHAVLAWAERRVPSGQAALYMTALPLWTVAIGAVRERRLPGRRVVAGLATGVLGVVVLVQGGAAPAAGTVPGASPLLGLAIVGGALAWAVGSFVARDGAPVESAVQSTAMQLAAGAVVVLAASIVSGELAAWHPAAVARDAAVRAGVALAFLVVCGTVLGFGAYTWLLRVARPSAVASYGFVNPAVAVALAWVIGDEPASLRTLVALALVTGAVVLTWERGPATPAADGPRPRR